MQKKGMLDMLFFVIALFTLSILIILSYFLLTETHDEMDNSGVIDSESLSILTNLKDSYVGLGDFIFTASLFGIVIFVVISSFYIRSHVVLIMMGILALILFGYFAIIMSGTYSEIADNPALRSTSSEFTVIPYVMERFHWFVIGLFTLVGIVLYGKRPET